MIQGIFIEEVNPRFIGKVKIKDFIEEYQISR